MFYGEIDNISQRNSNMHKFMRKMEKKVIYNM